MEWYNYIAVFFAGAFLSNAMPHFINGVSGNKFPTPFSKPPGKGLSSPTLNVLWATLNFIIGIILARVGKLHQHNHPAHLVFFIGFLAMALLSSNGFSKKDKE
jgi:hypothetical protein